MTVTLIIPDELSSDLIAKFPDLGRAALEALAAEGYEKDAVSLEQVRRLLNLPSRWEAQELLSRHGVWPGQTADEIWRDAEVAARFRVAKP